MAMLLAAAPARAEEDAQLWTAIAATGPVRGELGLFAYAEVRAGNDVSRPSQTVLGIGAGWDRSPRFSLYGGYLLTTTRLAGPNLREHRLWQQASYAIATAGRVRFSGRTISSNGCSSMIGISDGVSSSTFGQLFLSLGTIGFAWSAMASCC